MPNIYQNIPATLPDELFEELISTDSVRLERILSKGHASPKSGWYDQDQREWVLVLAGHGVLEFADGEVLTLNAGDYCHIDAHRKHRVASTSADEVTVWLALFY